MQIKLTLWRLYVVAPDRRDFREAAGLSAYSDLVRMTGRGLDAEITRIGTGIGTEHRGTRRHQR